MKIKYLLVVVASASLLSACNQSLQGPHHQKRSHAPTSNADVGYIVDNISDTELAGFVQKHPLAQFRVVSAKHNIYEVFNVSRSEIEKDLSDAGIYKNDFFKPNHLQEADLSPKGLKSLFLALNEETKEDRSPASEETEETNEEDEKKLNECVEDADSPLAVVGVIEPVEDLQDGIIELGTLFKLHSKDSTAHENHASDLKKGWAIITPPGSNFEDQLFFQDEIEFEPDAYGLYTVVLAVQDERNVCNFATARIIVTGNKPFVGKDVDVDEILKSVDLSIFDHRPLVKADEADQVSQGEGVVVAVIDGGVNYNHAALLKNVLVNTKEIPDNGVDDDGNGAVDDYVGYDFAFDDPYPYDDNGHGSHVSGLTASPLFGMAKKASIMPLKALTPAGGDTASLVGAIYYAVDNGAQVINMSFGQYGRPHPKMLEAFDYAEEKGVLIITAAGNGNPQTGKGIDTDKVAHFPSTFPHENIVNVASRGTDTLLAPYSNFGPQTVDVVAPGGVAPEALIVSCYMDNPKNIAFIGMPGTSMAAPIVAGIAAQMLSLKPDLKPEEVRALLLQAGEKIEGLEELVQSGRYIDSLSALELAQQLPSAELL